MGSNPSGRATSSGRRRICGPSNIADHLLDKGLLPERELLQVLDSGRQFKAEPIPLLTPSGPTGLAVIEGMLVPQVGGGAFATYDDIINALALNRSQTLQYAKATFTSVASKMYDTWLMAGGYPATGTFGSALTGRTISSATTGSVLYNNAGGGRQMSVTGVGMLSANSAGTVLLYDRLVEYPFDGTATSGSFNAGAGIAPPSRDVNGAALGDGVLAFVENFSATANGSVTLTLAYTDQGGTGSNTTAPVIIASSTSGKEIVNPNSAFFIPLAAGDTGIRSIQSYTLSGTATSTQMCVSLVRPLGIYIPILAANTMIERDTILQIAGLPTIYDSSALSFIYFSNTTANGFNGYIRIAEG